MKIPDNIRNCEDDCRFTVSEGMTTLVAYIPIYDKDGKNINPDMNTSSGAYSCFKCNRLFLYKSVGGVVTWEERT
jgi:hypothetical protein